MTKATTITTKKQQQRRSVLNAAKIPLGSIIGIRMSYVMNNGITTIKEAGFVTAAT